MAEHGYICKEGHKFSLSVKVGTSPPKQTKCAQCGEKALYDWASKRIGGTVYGGTGGGRKRRPHNQERNSNKADEK